MRSSKGTGTIAPPCRQQGAHRAGTEVAGVVEVEGARLRAAELVADVLLDEGRLDAEAGEVPEHGLLHHAAEGHLRQADVAVLVARRVLQPLEVARLEPPAEALGEYGHAVGPSHGEPLHDGALDDARDRREADVPLGELLGDERQGGARRLRRAEGQVAGAAAHHHDQVPAARGARVLHQPRDDARRILPRRLEAEGRDALGQRQVVVDGLRYVGDADAASGLLRHAPGRESGVVAADRHQVVDAELGQGAHDRRQVVGLLGGVGPGGLEHRPAQQVDARDLGDVELAHPVGATLDQEPEALQQAEHAGAVAPRQDRGGADHPVDAGGRPASHQDSERGHARPSRGG
jgi:hypothetical protein